jgi:hypothetical protein
MSNTLKQNNLRTGMTVRAFVVTLSLTMAAFGCSTNQFASSGEPVRATPAGGPMTPSLTTTPGSAGPAIPVTMVSGAVDASVDAIAIREANRGFQGRVLGPANPGGSMTFAAPTNRVVSPSLYANPQRTINSSISSPAVAAIPSDATGVASTPGLAPVGMGTNGNFGVTGVSNTTAASFAAPTPVITNTVAQPTPSLPTTVSSAPVRLDTTSGAVTVTNTSSSNP